MPNKCNTCVFLNKPNNICQYTGNPVELNDFCSKHQFECDSCSVCRRPIPNGQGLVDGDLLLCAKCNEMISGCGGCVYGNVCIFETDPDPMPKIVNQQFVQGNAVVNTQARNPEREKKFCPSCQCWNKEEEHCMKMFGIGCNKCERVQIQG